MIRINLLVERKQKKQKKVELPPLIGEQKKGLGFLTLLAIVTGTTILVMALVVFFLQSKVSDLKSEYGNNQGKIAEFKKKIEEVKKYEALNKAIQQKASLIENLKKNQSVPVRLLDDLSNLLPDGIWLSTVAYNNTQVTIEGIGFTNMDIVAFVENLKKSSTYTEVYLEETKQAKVDKTDVYNFKLNFKVRI
jgi:type IV pilus assembly protein PilN